MEIPKESHSNYTFMGKDDGEEKRVSLFIRGKHGTIGIIRPEKVSTEADKREFIESLAQVVVRSTIKKNKEKEAPGNP